MDWPKAGLLDYDDYVPHQELFHSFGEERSFESEDVGLVLLDGNWTVKSYFFARVVTNVLVLT